MDGETMVEDSGVQQIKSPKRSFPQKLRVKLKRLFPVIVWLPNYKWKEHTFFDMIAGVTIACVSVPQSLAFAVLANVDLIYGLNTACFSALVYTLLGTAPISAFGPVAIGSMLSGEAISKFDKETSNFSKDEFVAALTISIGIFYLIMYVLRLGVLTVVFKKPFVSGYIMACALHILIKSLRQLIGINVQTYYGYFNFFYNSIRIFSKVGESHVPTLIISAVTMTVFLFNMIVLTPFLKKRSSIVIPIETIVMVTAIVFSYFLKFKDMGVAIVGTVPTGLPKIVPLNLNAYVEAFPEAVLIALINYTTTTSMTLLFNPQMDREQEILAMAVSNIVCGNFQCITIGNSMMRTMIAINLGIRTLFATMFSSFLLFIIILYAGPLFEPLPLTILGCIIMTAVIKLLYERIKDIIKFSRSKEDLFIFFATFLATLIIDVTVGLVVGAVLSLRTILEGVVQNEENDREVEGHILLQAKPTV
ncbi:prestin-like [Cimex lectularius]|uniref:SLC26A/SulP transporter domain-containing protein n=1 Tax=Cimex lectularius TaxID=79782 RepID=A0A8I6R746_CIMLE|nr:prestin-like [Cimex lectularius]